MASQRQETSNLSGPIQLAKMCALAASDKKAEHISVLDVSKLTSFADYLVISSANGERQAQAIARQVMSSAKEHNIAPLGIEGLVEGHWILIDLGDVIFHVFTHETRGYYDLDGLWADAPNSLQINNPPIKGKTNFVLAPLCEF